MVLRPFGLLGRLGPRFFQASGVAAASSSGSEGSESGMKKAKSFEVEDRKIEIRLTVVSPLVAVLLSLQQKGRAKRRMDAKRGRASGGLGGDFRGILCGTVPGLCGIFTPRPLGKRVFLDGFTAAWQPPSCKKKENQENHGFLENRGFSVFLFFGGCCNRRT